MIERLEIKFYEESLGKTNKFISGEKVPRIHVLEELSKRKKGNSHF